MPQTKKTGDSESNKKLDEILKRLDMLTIVQLAQSGLTLKDTA